VATLRSVDDIAHDPPVESYGALQELRDRWRKAEARVERFTANTLLWREAREEADAARRTFERGLVTLSKETRPE
jgi:hypothetical protein